MRFATRWLAADDHVTAPDGSEVRILVGLARRRAGALPVAP